MSTPRGKVRCVFCGHAYGPGNPMEQHLNARHGEAMREREAITEMIERYGYPANITAGLPDGSR